MAPQAFHELDADPAPQHTHHNQAHPVCPRRGGVVRIQSIAQVEAPAGQGGRGAARGNARGPLLPAQQAGGRAGATVQAAQRAAAWCPGLPSRQLTDGCAYACLTRQVVLRCLARRGGSPAVMTWCTWVATSRPPRPLPPLPPAAVPDPLRPPWQVGGGVSCGWHKVDPWPVSSCWRRDLSGPLGWVHVGCASAPH